MAGGRPRAVWAGAAAAVVLATAAALVVVLAGDPGERDLRTAATLVAVLLCGGAALASLEVLERRILGPLGGILVAAASADLVVLLLGIWKAQPFDGQDDDWVKLIPIGLAWGTATLVVATLPLAAGQPRSVLAGVAACAVAWAGVATGLVLAEHDADAWLKILGAFAVLMVGGFLLAPLLRRLVAERR